METISGLASAASKAVFGEGAKNPESQFTSEPVSGEQGAGSGLEPYDKGNLEDQGEDFCRVVAIQRRDGEGAGGRSFSKDS